MEKRGADPVGGQRVYPDHAQQAAWVSIVTGKPPQEEPQAAPAGPEGAEPLRDALDELLAFGEQFDNIVIQ